MNLRADGLPSDDRWMAGSKPGQDYERRQAHPFRLTESDAPSREEGDRNNPTIERALSVKLTQPRSRDEEVRGVDF